MGKTDNQVFYGENRKMWNVGGRGTQDVIVNGMTMAGGHLKGDIWAKTWIDSGNILRTFQIEPIVKRPVCNSRVSDRIRSHEKRSEKEWGYGCNSRRYCKLLIRILACNLREINGMPFNKMLSDTLMELPLPVVLILRQLIIHSSEFNEDQIFGTCCVGNHINTMIVLIQR